MKERIEAVLADLIGLQMTEHHRAADLEMLHFGRGNRSEYALHVQCPWRLQRSGSLVVGYRDMRDPPAGVSFDGWDPDEAKVTGRDELLGAFFAEREAQPRVIVEVEASDVGDVRITFDDGSVLVIFPDSTAIDDEYWRLLRLGNDGEHYVVGGNGFERVPALRREH